MKGATPTVAGIAAADGRARISAIDAARGVAVVGMITVNVGPRTGEGLAALLYRVPLGRASLLFVLLAGLGVSLMSRRARSDGQGAQRGGLLWRAGLLLLGGLALQLLDHGASVILPTYALLFVLTVPFLRSPDRLLLVIAVALMVIGPLVWIALQMAGGVNYAFQPANLTDPPGRVLRSVVLSGPYPLITWVGPFLLGMWLGRRSLTDRVVQVRMIILGSVFAVTAFAVSRIIVAVLGDPSGTVGLDRLVTAVAHSQMPLWLLSGTGSALLVLGILLRAGDFIDRWLAPLVATGQLALTAYVGHLIALDFLVRPEPHVLAEGVLISAGMVGVTVIMASLWRKWFSRGPLEALLRAPWK